MGLWCGVRESQWGPEGTETDGNTKTEHCRSSRRNVSQRCIDRYLHFLIFLLQNNLLNPLRSGWSIRHQLIFLSHSVVGKPAELMPTDIFPVNFLSSSTVHHNMPSGLPLSLSLCIVHFRATWGVFSYSCGEHAIFTFAGWPLAATFGSVGLKLFVRLYYFLE